MPYKAGKSSMIQRLHNNLVNTRITGILRQLDKHSAPQQILRKIIVMLPEVYVLHSIRIKRKYLRLGTLGHGKQADQTILSNN